MKWKTLTILTALCVVTHYGPAPFLYVAVACIFFLLGLVFSMGTPMPPIKYLKRKCEISKGLPAVTASMDYTGVYRPKIKLSSSPALDVVLNQIISYILRDYIYSWYSTLTSDVIFPNELHRLLQQIVTNLLGSISQNNWTPFLTESLPVYMASHIRLYRLMLGRLDDSPNKDPIKLFFDCEWESEKTTCREQICISKDEEEKYLRSLSEMFLFFILPSEEYRVPAIRYIARELLVRTVLLPTVDLLADPDFVNRSVSWLAKDSAFTSEYFVQSLRMSDSTEELMNVVEQASSFMDKLRGFDSGGLDDASIKAQLGSLDYVRKVCDRRLQQIKEGVIERPENYLAYRLQPGTQLYDMSFDEVMSKSVALVSFLDFLSSIDKDSLLRLYLNCVSYRENAESLLLDHDSFARSDCFSSSADAIEHPNYQGLSSKPVDCQNGTDTVADTNDLAASTEESTGLDGAVSTRNDVSVSNPTVDLSEPATALDDLKAFGVLLCSNLLKQLPPSAEPLVHQVLRNLTTNLGVCDPKAFIAIESKLLELLSDSQCFGAFKRSPQYIQLLAELDFLKESTDQNSSSNSAPNDAISSGIFLLSNDVTGSAISKQTSANTSINLSPRTFEFGSPEEYTPISESKIYPESSTHSITSASTCVEPHTMTYCAQIIRTEIMHDSYVLYTLKVTCTSVDSGHADFWQTLRRYSHFAELHSLITEQCNNFVGLKLPPKRPFSNLSEQFLSRRRRELNEYLSASGFNPFRSVSNAMKAVPETLADGFSRVFSAMQPNTHGSHLSAQFSHGRSASLTCGPSRLPDFISSKSGESADQIDDGPIGALFLLVDEMFGLRQKSHLSRDTNFMILRKIFQAFFGLRVNKMIIAKANELTSPHRLAEFLAYLRDFIWPPADTAERTRQLPERDNEMKLRTRVLCRTMLLGSVSEDLAQFLGNETTRRGVSRVFRLLQYEPLNRRLVYCVLEAVLCQIFHTHQGPWENLIEEQLCPSKSGRPCQAHPASS
ncbi:unnamed protein product [Dicrocoelium dendriticum]|nr:unnamed protein product [Dicrocoelium dendriticum]